MFQVNLLLQILVLLMVSVSGLLLGFAQGDTTLTLIAIIGSTAGFVLTDWLKLLRIDGFVANIVAIVATVYAIFNFAGGSVAQQLLSVANLLVYLQIVLLFEKKTPRLYWQVLVLSVLQVVVASAFNLGLEGGLLFIGYMIVAGCTMMVLRLYHDAWEIEQSNKPRKKEIEKSRVQLSPKALGPIAVFENRSSNDGLVFGMLRHVGWIGFCGIGFTIALFYFVPRNAEAWKGSDELTAMQAGSSKQTNLDPRGRIRLSSSEVMKVTFRQPRTGEIVHLSEEPLIRGVAMSNLQIRNGITDWQIPTDLNPDLEYSRQSSTPALAQLLLEEIEIQPTGDPMIHTASPAFESQNTPAEIRYAHALESFTRGSKGETISGTNYKYEFLVPVNTNLTLWKFTPHKYFIGEDRPISQASQNRYARMLLEIDKDRYPQLVKKAEEIANANQSVRGRRMQFDNPFETMLAMESYFLESTDFKYTLDFTDVPRDNNLDPIEDFVANHKSGHCELYASALTLMLRSQGIPARFVVGYKGGEYNEEEGHYLVQDKHAHAWVEAYVGPQIIAPGMPRNQYFSTSGVWVTLDPTPGSIDQYEDDLVDQATSLFGAMESYWKENVLGRNSEHDLNGFFSNPNDDSAARVLNIDWWASLFGLSENSGSESGFRIIHVILPAGIVLLFGWAWYSSYRKSSLAAGERIERVSLWRRVLGAAVSVVMPKVGKWIIESGGSRSTTVQFYRRFMKMMGKHGLERHPAQTHREFAAVANHHFHTSAKSDQIQSLVDQITNVFYRARFAGPALDNEQTESIEQAVSRLEKLLESSSASSGTA